MLILKCEYDCARFQKCPSLALEYLEIAVATCAMDSFNPGGVTSDRFGFRARIQPRDAQEIRGPKRRDKTCAEQDLASIRAVATHPNREERLAAMREEAQLLKDGAHRDISFAKEIGRICCRENHYYARIKPQGATEFQGPARRDKNDAEQDLALIRAAAKDMHREEGVAAMRAEAHRLKEGARREKEHGSVITRQGTSGNVFIACLERKVGGVRHRVVGPRRGEKRRAEEDLSKLRDATRNKKSDEEAYEAIDAEAHKLQQQAAYEARIAVSAHRLVPPTSLQPEQQPQEPSDGENDWGEGDPYAGDAAPEWEIYEDARERGLDPAAPVRNVKLPEPRTPDEATALLANFRATQNTPEVLHRILERRADPNIHLGKGHIPPLENVMVFAHPKHVKHMRELLLQYGATNTPFLEADWRRRLHADAVEERRQASLRYDDR